MGLELTGILLVSDLDGTLSGENFVVPQRNLDAIARFQEAGRKFCHCHRAFDTIWCTLCRAYPSQRPLYLPQWDDLYDYLQERMLWNCSLEQTSAAGYIQTLYDQFPDCGN